MNIVLQGSPAIQKVETQGLLIYLSFMQQS